MLNFLMPILCDHVACQWMFDEGHGLGEFLVAPGQSRIPIPTQSMLTFTTSKPDVFPSLLMVNSLQNFVARRKFRRTANRRMPVRTAAETL